MKYLKGIIAGLLIILAVCLFAAGLKGKTAGDQTDQKPEKINVLILPKFEDSELAGDFPEEAQFY